jgi:aromatic ring-opening dioxygenase catalytic subunit (LigB family)
MAQLCLGLATSHLAHIVNARELAEPQQISAFDAGYRRLAKALDDAAPDVTLLISAEHVNKFFIDNMPAFCIGVFDAFGGPVEARGRDVGYPYRRVPSDMHFARYLVERGLDEGVDWATAEIWDVDHGMMVPLHKLDPDGRHKMVPIFVNCAAPPLPSPRRCYAVGRWLAAAIARWDVGKRVGIIATGGLSHSVGSLQQGYIDEAFDRRFLAAFCAGEGEWLATLSDAEIAATGSATGEIRSWIMLAGAFAGKRAECVFYEPIRGFETGCAQCVMDASDGSLAQDRVGGRSRRRQQ